MKKLGPEFTVEYPMNVRLTRAKFCCTKCGKWKPASHFGLRAVGDVVRNQPQCKPCRSPSPKLTVVK